MKNRILDVRDLKTWFPVHKGVLARCVGHVRAVDGVTFHIDKGETLGLVGESGCGKTTLGRTLLRLETACSGQMLFMGMNLTDLSERAFRGIRKSIQIIFQDPLSSLNPKMTIMDIVTEGMLEFRMIRKKDREEQAAVLLQEVGLDRDMIFRYPHEFSGGQRQRINIARAVSLRPDFIVCDEPVSALDVSVQAQVINLLADLREKHHLSYLFISHDLSVVSHISDRILVMYLGRIVEQGPTDRIIGNPLHPYTQALMEAVPVPGKKLKHRHILAGGTPSALTPPEGCRFHPRCTRVMDICRTKVPARSYFDGREVVCHLFSTETGNKTNAGM